MKIIQIEIPNDLSDPDMYDLVDAIDNTIKKFDRYVQPSQRIKFKVGTLHTSL